MRDVLYGVALTVGVVVHRINAPLVPCPVVGCVLDSVENRIAEHHVRAGHVNFGTKHLGSVRIHAGLHLPENAEVLLHAPVPVRALSSRLVHSTAACAYFFLSLVIDVCQTLAYHFLGPFVKLVEVVGSIFLLVPLESEPLDILLDRVNVFGILLGRICVIEPEIGLSAIFLGKTEIQADALRMSKMKVTVRLRRESRQNAVHFSGFEVGFNDFLKEIEFSRLSCLFLHFFHLLNSVFSIFPQILSGQCRPRTAE